MINRSSTKNISKSFQITINCLKKRFNKIAMKRLTLSLLNKIYQNRNFLILKKIDLKFRIKS